MPTMTMLCIYSGSGASLDSGQAPSSHDYRTAALLERFHSSWKNDQEMMDTS